LRTIIEEPEPPPEPEPEPPLKPPVWKHQRRMLKTSISYGAYNYSRWSYNPHDERGQGNMGKPDMVAPYGHDKDSDRLELTGSRGKVIRSAEPPPEPEPPPDPEPEPPHKLF
jgi:hypothetical protein